MELFALFHLFPYFKRKKKKATWFVKIITELARNLRLQYLQSDTIDKNPTLSESAYLFHRSQISSYSVKLPEKIMVVTLQNTPVQELYNICLKAF